MSMNYYGGRDHDTCAAKLLGKYVGLQLCYWGIPLLAALAACGFFWMGAVENDKYDEHEHITVYGTIEQKDKYNHIKNEGSKEAVTETWYRLMIKPDRPDPKHPMKEHIVVDNVAWGTWASKDVGDHVGFKLDKDDVFKQRSGGGEWFVAGSIAGIVGGLVCVGGAFILFVGACACDGDDARRDIRNGEGVWHSYMHN